MRLSKTSTRVAFGALCVIVAAGLSFAQPTTAPAKTAKVSDPAKHFEFSSPTTWENVPPNQANMVLMVRSPSEGPQDSFLENVNVVIVNIPGGAGQVTLDQIVPEAIAGVKAKVKATAVSEIVKGTLDGESSRTVTLEVQMNGITARSRQTYVLKGDDFYIITYSASADAKPEINDAVDEIMKSWKFLK